MKNLTNPVQETMEFYNCDIEPETKFYGHLSLSPNEFTDNDDSIGFLSFEPEPYLFLSEDKLEKAKFASEKAELSFIIELSKKEN